MTREYILVQMLLCLRQFVFCFHHLKTSSVVSIFSLVNLMFAYLWTTWLLHFPMVDLHVNSMHRDPVIFSVLRYCYFYTSLMTYVHAKHGHPSGLAVFAPFWLAWTLLHWPSGAVGTFISPVSSEICILQIVQHTCRLHLTLTVQPYFNPFDAVTSSF